jgi:hypothetical protein
MPIPISYPIQQQSPLDLASIQQRQQALKQQQQQQMMANIMAVAEVMQKQKQLKLEEQKLNPTPQTAATQILANPMAMMVAGSDPDFSKRLTDMLNAKTWDDYMSSQLNSKEGISTEPKSINIPAMQPAEQQTTSPIQNFPQLGSLEDVFAQMRQPGGMPMSFKGGTFKGMQFGADPMAQEYMKRKFEVATENLKAESKRKQSAEATMSGTARFTKQFGRSYNELKTMFPDIGEIGYTGWMTRKGAQIANYFDQLPETKAFTVRLKPIANQMARDVEGGRITDQDRQIYADSFVNALKNPSETNIRLASEALLDLRDKGGDISKVVNELATSEVDIIQKIVLQVLESSPDWEVSNE